jgi:fumarate hydratase class II
MTDIRKETDSLGEVDVPADKLWGAQTQRSLEHFSIGKDLMPREMITAYATLKKAAANANFASERLDQKRHDLIARVCDEILAGQHHDMFPLHVWMTGSGTQFNMNVNEVISNRCCQIAGSPLGSKMPVHPNDHVNMAQSSNDSFPSAMNIAAAVNVKQRLIPAVKARHDAIAAKVEEWKDVIKIGRTHMQDATPLTLGQEWSGYEGVLADDLDRIEDGLKGVYGPALGGTAVGTAAPDHPRLKTTAKAKRIARITPPRPPAIPRGVRKVSLCLFAGENELVRIRVAEDRASSPDFFLRLGCEFVPSRSWLQQSQLRHLALHKPRITIHSLDGSQSSI